MSQQLNGRRGANFPIRLTDEDREELETMRDQTAGPAGLGPWLLWAARCAFCPPPVLPRKGDAGIANSSRSSGKVRGFPDRGNARRFTGERVILDLCAGTGCWSDPYRLAEGYRVIHITLPEHDVRTFNAMDGVHGILAAPPCTEFSLAKNGHERDTLSGLEVVGACLRIIAGCRPVWWALENPVGLLSAYMGTPRVTFQPFEFGDPWTKPTALWGDFSVPICGPFATPIGSAMDRSTAEERAFTPEGFARKFFESNP